MNFEMDFFQAKKQKPHEIQKHIYSYVNYEVYIPTVNGKNLDVQIFLCGGKKHCKLTVEC